MNSFIDVIWQYRIYAVIVLFIALSARFAYFYHTSVYSPKSRLAVKSTFILKDDVKVYLVTLKNRERKNIQNLVHNMRRHGFSFAGSMEMRELRCTKLPYGITIVSAYGDKALVIHVVGKPSHMLETTRIENISMSDKFTRFAVVYSRRISSDSTESVGKMSGDTIAA